MDPNGSQPKISSTKKPEALSNLEDGDGDSILSDDSAISTTVGPSCGDENPQRNKGRCFRIMVGPGSSNKWI